MKACLALLVVLALASASAARAEDCAHASTQTAMNICAGQAYKKSDAELNTIYRQIKSRLKNNQAATGLLLTAQQHWLAFRDAECAFASSGSAGGSVQPMIVAECRDELTAHRVKQLKTYLQCQEGDLSCPVPAS